MYPQVFKPAITVFGFWWMVLSAWALIRGDLTLEEGLHASMLMTILVVTGFVMGCVAVVAYIVLERRTRIAELGPTSVRGLQCSIGPVPMNARPPQRSEALPNFEIVPDIPKDFYPLWLKHFEESHPRHVALATAMLKVYQAQPALPATHVKGGHGGRTLLEHSLLVAYQMQTLAMKWSYTGLRDKTGKRVLLKLRDPNYAFSPLDPLVMLVGLAHDIGKIEAYIWQDTGEKTGQGREIVGCRHEHDLTGARILARLDELWDIPDADREAILLSIAHYHHPMELPLSPDRRAIDDRTIALMELLIKADFVASAIETKGSVPTEQDYETTMDQRSEVQETDEAVWEAFMGIIEETGRINSPDPKHNLGCICLVTGQNSMRLVLREDAIRGALMRRLAIQDASPIGDGRYPLTMRLLRLLDAKGFLVRKIGQSEYAAESAFWEIDFYGKRRGSGKDERITGWSSCIVVQPAVSKYIGELPSYGWAGHVLRGTLGGARTKKKASAAPASSDETAVPDSEVATDVGRANGDDRDSIAESKEPPKVQPIEPSNDMESGPPEAARQSSDVAHANPDHDAASAPSSRHQEPERIELIPLQSPNHQAAGGPTPAKSDHIIRTSQQMAALTPRSQSTALSPDAIKKHCATFMRQEAPKTAATGASGREVLIFSGPALVLRVPEIDWATQVPMLKVACEADARYGEFMVHEASGIFYLVVDAQAMRSFAANETRSTSPGAAVDPPEDSAI